MARTMASGDKIHVVIVDDHDLIRGGLVALLGHEEDITVVGEACNGLEAKHLVSSLKPDVVLMDIKMPVMDGIEATARITKEHPRIRVLVVTHLDNEEYARRFMKSGASGYLPKSCAAQELKYAIREVHAGRQYCSPSSPTKTPAPLSGLRTEGSHKGVALTPREREVLRMVASGSTNQEISTALQISVRTVEFHRANLIEKIGSKDAISLVRCAIEQNIISLDPSDESHPSPPAGALAHGHVTGEPRR